MYIKNILTVLTVTAALSASAQSNDPYVQAADRFYANGDYFSATQYYEKYLKGGKSKDGIGGVYPYAIKASSSKASTATVLPITSSNEEIVYRLAESYRNLHFPSKALPYYEQAVQFDQAKFPLAKFYYAETLKKLGKYDEAQAAFNQFKQEYAHSDRYSAMADLELQGITFIQDQMNRKDLKRFTITKAAGFDSDGGNYAPVLINNGSDVLFTSTRPQNGKVANRLYSSPYNNGAGAVSKIDISQANGIEQGVAAVSADGNLMYLTRWTVGKGTKRGNIYTSRKNGNTWSEPVLAAGINAEGSSTQQPALMGRDKILFSSNRPDGFGGYDLYIGDVDVAGGISNVRNLGSTINTPFDEQAPYWHQASGTLVFSSNGRVGMGGFDFYGSKLKENGAYDEPVNLGYPVNSIKDDVYFASTGSANNILQSILLSSDREDDCCLEIFALSKAKPLKALAGTVVDCDGRTAMEGITVQIIDTVNNQVVATQTTDGNGTYSFTLEEYRPLKAVAGKAGYFAGNVKFYAPSDTDADEYNITAICLSKIPEKPIRVDNVYYEFDKASLMPESFPSLDQLVALLNENPTINIELGAHTDSKGSDEYNLRLSEARAKSVVDYLVSKGIDKARLVSKGYGESQPVAANANGDGTDNPEGRAQNRRTEFKVLK